MLIGFSEGPGYLLVGFLSFWITVTTRFKRVIRALFPEPAGIHETFLVIGVSIVFDYRYKAVQTSRFGAFFHLKFLVPSRPAFTGLF